jgi:hypothetical protein
MVGDVTMEALTERLQVNPRGLLERRDELAGWLKSFDQYQVFDVSAPDWLATHGVQLGGCCSS